MKKLTSTLSIGLFALLFCSGTYAEETTKEATISTIPTNAAIYSINRGKRKFLGYSPLAINLEYSSIQQTNDILISKVGYELVRETIRKDSLNNSVRLKKRDLFAASTPDNETVYKQIKQRLRKVIYKDNAFVNRSNVTGQIHLVPLGDAYAISLEVLLLDDEVLKKLRKLSRGGKSKAKQTELARIVFDHSKHLLQKTAAVLKGIKSVQYIDLTVNFPVSKMALKFNRKEMQYYSVQEHKEYRSDKIVTTTVSGWTYSVMDTTNIYLRKRTNALKFIVSVDKMNVKGQVNISSFKNHVDIFLKERRDKKFKKIHSGMTQVVRSKKTRIE